MSDPTYNNNGVGGYSVYGAAKANAGGLFMGDWQYLFPYGDSWREDFNKLPKDWSEYSKQMYRQYTPNQPPSAEAQLNGTFVYPASGYTIDPAVMSQLGMKPWGVGSIPEAYTPEMWQILNDALARGYNVPGTYSPTADAWLTPTGERVATVTAPDTVAPPTNPVNNMLPKPIATTTQTGTPVQQTLNNGTVLAPIVNSGTGAPVDSAGNRIQSFASDLGMSPMMLLGGAAALYFLFIKK